MRAGASVIREIAGEEEFKRISEENPMRVIHGEAIEVVKPEKLEREKKKGFWSRGCFFAEDNDPVWGGVWGVGGILGANYGGQKVFFF